MKRTSADVAFCIIVMVAALLLSVLARGNEAHLTDLTSHTQSVERKETHNLDLAHGRTMVANRQILVTRVGAKSPVDRVVKVDDVILGADGKPFGDDARKTIALAIEEGETKARDGVLNLTVWRAGQMQDLSLKLAVMGTYVLTYALPLRKVVITGRDLDSSG